MMEAAMSTHNKIATELFDLLPLAQAFGLKEITIDMRLADAILKLLGSPPFLGETPQEMDGKRWFNILIRVRAT